MLGAGCENTARADRHYHRRRPGHGGRLVAVEFKGDPELLDCHVDGLQRSRAVAAEIVIGMLQAEFGLFEGIKGSVDFPVMFVLVIVRIGSES